MGIGRRALYGAVAALAVPAAHAAGTAVSAELALFQTFSGWAKVLTAITIPFAVVVLVLGFVIRNPEWRARGVGVLLAVVFGVPLIYYLGKKFFKFWVP